MAILILAAACGERDASFAVPLPERPDSWPRPLRAESRPSEVRPPVRLGLHRETGHTGRENGRH